MRRLLLCMLLLSTLQTAVCLGVTHRHPAHDFNFDVPEHWELRDAKYGKSVFLTYQNIATINVEVFYFKEPVTANRFQLMRMGTHYDGWVNKFERFATAEETGKANAEEGYVAVYLKHGLTDSLSLEEFIVGEYYFTHETKGYVISVSTLRSHWQTIQDSLSIVLDSFWIGKGDRPTYVAPKLAQQRPMANWNMIGLGSQNQHSLPTRLALDHLLQDHWQFPLPYHQGHDPNSIAPVISEDMVYVAFHRSLYAINLKSGKSTWTFHLDQPISPGLVHHDGLLYFIKQGQPNHLIALQADSGQVQFSRPLKEHFSAPILVEDTLYIINGDALCALNYETGAEKWRQHYQANAAFYPVVDQDHVLVVSHSDTLLLCDRYTGKMIWDTPLEQSILFTPSLHGQHVIVSTRGDTAHAPQRVMCLSKETGATQWTFQDSQYTPTLLTAPSLANNMLVIQGLGYSDDSRPVTSLIGIDIANGSRTWLQPVPIVPTTATRPLISDSMIFISGTKQHPLYVLDLLTGEKAPFHIYDARNPIEVLHVRPDASCFVSLVKTNGKYLIICST